MKDELPFQEEKSRALAHIEKVEWIKPIEGADNIELIGVLGWKLIAKIGEFQVGDKCIYIETDSKCPADDERFAFLEPKRYKIRIMHLKKFGVYSEGIALPLTDFPECAELDIGTDVTDLLHIIYALEEDNVRKAKPDPDAKYKTMANRHPDVFKKPLIKKMMKYDWGKKLLFVFFGKKKDNPKEFPKWVKRTDEERIENCVWFLEDYNTWVASEKVDGTSGSFCLERLKKGKNKFDYAVCSRNVRQADRNQECYYDYNIYWAMSDKYNIESVLIDLANKYECDHVVIQGECIGSVQGNPYKLKEDDLYVFNLIFEGHRLGSVEAKEIIESYGMKFVPLLDTHHELPHDMESMKLEADGMSVINPKVKREGIVYRSLDGQQSFKNVSREYQEKLTKQIEKQEKQSGQTAQ